MAFPVFVNYTVLQTSASQTKKVGNIVLRVKLGAVLISVVVDLFCLCNIWDQGKQQFAVDIVVAPMLGG